MARRTTFRLAGRAVGAFVAMLLLAACSIAAALLLDGLAASVVPLGVAVITAGFVAIAFMEVRKMDAVSAIFAGVAVCFLAVLFGLTFTDELTRAHIPAGFEARTGD
ncbi:hypothetical protein ROJ8625_03345 [Roseivivax jejudonensis]|uniref:Uncharacterized protein n=1 Tax=Roseivivax jejudonensis TaxID=1529041 RepID=A0A1X7A0X5_9RHOB|nr:hypothetical protein [Roseivivax jejudonensis]SLN65441.1 hypothetical protein ROJ8625_03345 [Roseivivax jejudonensis]